MKPFSISVVLAMCIALSFVGKTQASTETNSANGINSVNVPFTGDGISIGQVEDERPGKYGFDDGSHSNVGTIPEAVYVEWGLVDPTANDFSEIDAHATEVAGVMISGFPEAPGVAIEAQLYASGYAITSVPFVPVYDKLSLTTQYVATRDNDDVRAINLSISIASGQPDGRSHFTNFVDWSASQHDVLYVAAGRDDTLLIGVSSPSDNYNGMTVGASARFLGAGAYRLVADLNDFSDDAVGDRTSIDILAPGVNVEVAAIGGPEPPERDGTSYAAPHVVGTVALLQEFGDAQIAASAPHWSVNARRHEVMKAVLMNSADKLIDNGTVVLPGETNPIPQGRLLGMERTVLDQGGNNWLVSDAYDDSVGGWGSEYPLDIQMDAGHLNAKRAYQQFFPGEYEADGSDVPLIGWDYGTTTGDDDFNRYRFDQSMAEGHFISITLAWDREVEFDIDLGTPGVYDAGDTFEDYIEEDPYADDVISDLDIYLLPRGSVSINQAVAEAISPEGTLEHMFFQIPETGDYELWVYQADEDVGSQDYGLAWWYGLAPEIALPGDFDGDGDVDGDDLGEWQDNFGTTGGASLADGDADSDGDVDGNDFLVWQRNFGSSVAGGAYVVAVPEPAAGSQLLLLCFTSVIFLWNRAKFLNSP